MYRDSFTSLLQLAQAVPLHAAGILIKKPSSNDQTSTDPGQGMGYISTEKIILIY